MLHLVYCENIKYEPHKNINIPSQVFYLVNISFWTTENESAMVIIKYLIIEKIKLLRQMDTTSWNSVIN